MSPFSARSSARHARRPPRSQAGARPDPSATHDRLGLFQVTLAAVLWGTAGVVLQLLIRRTGLGPLSIGFYRLAIASVALLLLSAAKLRSLWAAIRRRPVSLLVAGTGLALYQALYFVAVTAVGVSIATVVSLGIAPVVTAGWDSARRRRWPRPIQIATIGTALAGLTLVSLAHADPVAAPHPVLGLLAAIGSGLTYGITAMVSRHVAQAVPALASTTVTSFVGALVLAPVGIIGGLRFYLTAATAGGLLYIGVITMALAYVLFYAGLQSTPTSVAAVLTLVEPLTAAILAVTVLAEPLSPGTLAGCILLLAAVAALYLTPAPYLTPGI